MQKIRLLIISALAQEQKALKNIFSQRVFSGLEIDFCLTGVGNSHAIFTLQQYFLQKGVPDFCFNIGVCGKLSEEISDQVFQVYRIFHAAREKETLCPVYFSVCRLESILCSEKIITQQSEMKEEHYVDMESYGVDFVCSKYKVPYLLFKIPFDSVSPKSTKVDLGLLSTSFEKFPVEKSLQLLGKWIEKNPKDTPDFSKYFSHFGFTHSERQIFTQMYNKIGAYGKDFEEIFESKKSLSKKDFLSYLQKI